MSGWGGIGLGERVALKYCFRRFSYHSSRVLDNLGSVLKLLPRLFPPVFVTVGSSSLFLTIFIHFFFSFTDLSDGKVCSVWKKKK